VLKLKASFIMAGTNLRLELGSFDGSGGPIAAKRFLKAADRAMISGEIDGPRMAAIVGSLLKGDARIWYDAEEDANTPGLEDWATLRPLMEANFCKPLTIAQLAVLRASLMQQKDEQVSKFFTRCKAFHLAEDAELPAATRAAPIFVNEFQRRHKLSFMTGLRPEIKLHMRGLNPNRVTVDDMLEEALNSEILTTTTTQQGTVAAAAAEPSAEHSIAALTAGLSEEGKKTMEAVQQLMAFQFRGRGRGRGGGRGYGNYTQSFQGGRGRGGPSLAVLQGREKALCPRCNKMAKHRAPECYVNLEKSAGRGGGFTRGGQQPGRGRGQAVSYAQAASADGFDDPNQEFVVYEENSLN
jgi:hypothetical protein